jgi:hypothetical protein
LRATVDKRDNGPVLTAKIANAMTDAPSRPAISAPPEQHKPPAMTKSGAFLTRRFGPVEAFGFRLAI